MTNKYTRFFNIISRHGYEFNQSEFDLLEQASNKILKIIKKDLLKTPERTSNYLMSIYNEIAQGQKQLHKTYILEIEKLIFNKNSPKEGVDVINNNYELAGIALNQLEDIKSYILEAIFKLYPKYFITNKEFQKDIKHLLPPKKWAHLINSESPNLIQFKLKDNYFDTVLNNLKDYFEEEQHDELFKLLEGKEINYPLMFNGNKNQLTELFKRLEYNNLIKIPKTKLELANWIVKNFTTKKGDFVFNQVYREELTKTDFHLNSKKRILNSIECLTENQLKERNEKNKNKSPLP